MIAAIRDAGEEIATTLGSESSGLASPLSGLVRHGDVAGELGAIDDERHADLAVVGSSESSGHRVAGSIALRLVRAGRWPVVAVP